MEDVGKDFVMKNVNNALYHNVRSYREKMQNLVDNLCGNVYINSLY